MILVSTKYQVDVNEELFSQRTWSPILYELHHLNSMSKAMESFVSIVLRCALLEEEEQQQ